MRHPIRIQNFLGFMRFFRIFCKIVRWRHHFSAGDWPSPAQNPRSASRKRFKSRKDGNRMPLVTMKGQCKKLFDMLSATKLLFFHKNDQNYHPRCAVIIFNFKIRHPKLAWYGLEYCLHYSAKTLQHTYAGRNMKLVRKVHKKLYLKLYHI